MLSYITVYIIVHSTITNYCSIYVSSTVVEILCSNIAHCSILQQNDDKSSECYQGCEVNNRSILRINNPKVDRDCEVDNRSIKINNPNTTYNML